jgi:asparagine synthase (glutamine-hydrolysing)
MCGILAVITKHEQQQLDKIREGFEILNKRGPDFSSFEITDQYIVGFKRLSIVDTSAAGNQPFISNNILMMCNGEIYNHKELRTTYELNCTSNSDCEVIIELYKKFGFNRTIELLDGDFAIILISNNEIYFARDRIGVRPLFIGYTNQNNIAIASVASALSGYCKKIIHLKPGVYRYNKDTDYLQTTGYKYPSYTSFSNIDLIYTTINTTLTNAVRKRLMSERQVCTMLSGGLDSSLITSILCQLIGPSNVNTYSIGMTGSSDLRYAKIVADYLGTNHTEVLFTPEEGFAEIPNIIRDTETYDITTIRASVGMYLLSKYISKNTNDIVVLSGEGSDELFMGYLYFHLAPTSEEANEESKRLVQELYLYDALRADRTVSSHGLELRVPFLDKDMINLCFTLHEEYKIPIDNIEKHLLRSSFAEGYLPDEILWRKKEAFSDGVSGTEKKWYQQIQDFVDLEISDEEFEIHKNIFPSKESYYYKKIFDRYFPDYQPTINYWLPRWVNTNCEPSATVLNVYKS